MSRKLILSLAVLALVGLGIAYAVFAPRSLPDHVFADLGDPDLVNGEQVFWAGGCASCHAAPKSTGDDKLVLAGGLGLESDFGTFHVPNISPSKTAGIGNFTLAQFGNAMLAGVTPSGNHYYPSFPFGSYIRMTPTDLRDLYGFMQTLPESDNVAPPHKLGFPFNIRLAVGGWKFLFFNGEPRVELANLDDQLRRGQYLVEGPGHCGECHTPRNAIGGFKSDAWLSGGPNPDGLGNIPNITSGEGGIGDWSADDIVNYLETGFTPDFDSVGGSMVDVQENMARLTSEDRQAIAAYLKAIPARPNGY